MGFNSVPLVALAERLCQLNEINLCNSCLRPLHGSNQRLWLRLVQLERRLLKKKKTNSNKWSRHNLTCIHYFQPSTFQDIFLDCPTVCGDASRWLLQQPVTTIRRACLVFQDFPRQFTHSFTIQCTSAWVRGEAVLRSTEGKCSQPLQHLLWSLFMGLTNKWHLRARELDSQQPQSAWGQGGFFFWYISLPYITRWNSYPRFQGGVWLPWWLLALGASRGPRWVPGPDACIAPWVPCRESSIARKNTWPSAARCPPTARKMEEKKKKNTVPRTKQLLGGFAFWFMTNKDWQESMQTFSTQNKIF